MGTPKRGGRGSPSTDLPCEPIQLFPVGFIEIEKNGTYWKPTGMSFFIVGLVVYSIHEPSYRGGIRHSSPQTHPIASTAKARGTKKWLNCLPCHSGTISAM